MQREIEVMEELGPVCPEIPKLLERGLNFIVIEHFEQDVPAPPRPRPLPFWAIRQLSAFIKRCVAQGFDPIGLSPRDNVILTSSGIRIVEFDLWRRCDPTTPAERCYAVAGLPKDDHGDRPIGVPPNSDPWPVQWFPDTALSLRSFLYDPYWLQRIKQAMHLTALYTRWLGRKLGTRVLPSLALKLVRLVLPPRVRSALRLAFGG